MRSETHPPPPPLLAATLIFKKKKRVPNWNSLLQNRVRFTGYFSTLAPFLLNGGSGGLWGIWCRLWEALHVDVLSTSFCRHQRGFSRSEAQKQTGCRCLFLFFFTPSLILLPRILLPLSLQSQEVGCCGGETLTRFVSVTFCVPIKSRAN